MERDGRIFSCDHYVYDDYCIGNLNQQPLSQMVRSVRQRAFAEAKTSTLPGSCRRCPYLFACYGECPKRRFLRAPDGEHGLNYLCSSYRRFFQHAGTRLKEHGRLKVPQRAPPVK